MRAYRLFIPGMVCGSAVDSIERTLRTVAGVCGVEPEPLQHIMRVDVEPDSDASDLVRAVERVGYQVSDCSPTAVEPMLHVPRVDLDWTRFESVQGVF